MNIQFPRDAEPNAIEKRNQLNRLLATKLLKKSPKLSQLLTFLVESDMDGTSLDQEIVGIRVYGRQPSWVPLDDSCVRDGMSRLRKLLDVYYAFEGVEDRLNLELDQYKPVFSYNRRHPLEREFRRGLRHLATDPKVAFTHLDAVLSMDPNHAEAFAARAEAELWRPMLGNEVGLADILEAAEFQVQQSLQCDSTCWRAHLAQGALQACHQEWTAARTAFDRALKSSPEQARAHPWYAAFLMAMGHTEEALELTKARASEPSDTPWPLLTHATFLYAARRFEEAQALIQEARQDFDDTWLSHALWSCNVAASGRHQSTVPLLGMSLPQTLPDGTEVYTGLSILETIRRLSPEGPDYLKIKPVFQSWVSAKLTAWESPPGDGIPLAQRERRVSPCHLAIGFMALGENLKAIKMLAIDVERGHPLMTWLPLWPLFDPLRELPEFKALIMRMNLPCR